MQLFFNLPFLFSPNFLTACQWAICTHSLQDLTAEVSKLILQCVAKTNSDTVYSRLFIQLFILFFAWTFPLSQRLLLVHHQLNMFRWYRHLHWHFTDPGFLKDLHRSNKPVGCAKMSGIEGSALGKVWEIWAMGGMGGVSMRVTDVWSAILQHHHILKSICCQRIHKYSVNDCMV